MNNLPLRSNTFAITQSSDMTKNKTINVKGTAIVVISSQENDFISLTDIARYKDALHTDDIIKLDA